MEGGGGGEYQEKLKLQQERSGELARMFDSNGGEIDGWRLGNCVKIAEKERKLYVFQI